MRALELIVEKLQNFKAQITEISNTLTTFAKVEDVNQRIDSIDVKLEELNKEKVFLGTARLGFESLSNQISGSLDSKEKSIEEFLQQAKETVEALNPETIDYEPIKKQVEVLAIDSYSRLSTDIKAEIAKIPLPKNGKNGKSLEPNYQVVDFKIAAALRAEADKQPKKEPAKPVVTDVTLSNGNELIVKKSDGAKKTILLPTPKGGGGVIVQQGQSGAGIDFDAYEEVTALENDDYLLINRGGELKKIKASNARDYLNPPDGAVMVDGNFIVVGDSYVTV